MGDDMTLTDPDVAANGHATDPRIAELEAELRRERLVRENLAARVGALIAENLDLLVRLNDGAS